MSLALEEKYDQVRQLIAMGKERGYLLYDEVNDILPAEVHSSEENTCRRAPPCCAIDGGGIRVTPTPGRSTP